MYTTIILSITLVLVVYTLFKIIKLESFIKKHGTQIKSEETRKIDNMSEDELYDLAKQEVIKAGKASASLLQRRLRIGYARAARLLDILEENGVIGPVQGQRLERKVKAN